jgi:hypothetical protein
MNIFEILVLLILAYFVVGSLIVFYYAKTKGYLD